MKILMVCLGNICRSPLAEGIMQDLANKKGLNWEVDSAGTLAYHNGNPPHPLSCEVATENGIDISHQISRLFLKEDFKRFDIIFSMANDVSADIERIGEDYFNPKKIALLMDVQYPGEARNVPDPYYGSKKDYTIAFNMIYNACTTFIEQHINRTNQVSING